MTVSGSSLGSPMDSADLERALAAFGWIMVHEESGVYRRWRRPEEQPPRTQMERSTVIIPLDSSRGDYEELLSDASRLVGALTALDPGRVQRALADLTEPVGDTLLFRKETRMRAGRLPWIEGRALYEAAERTLIAAAKAEVSRSPYFGNTHGLFARRFLDACVMGQTQVGSFIVTAYTPVTIQFPESLASSPAAKVSPVHTGRAITLRLIEALGAAQGAAQYFRSAGSLAAFEDSVQHGVSREMTDALHTMVAGDSTADVKVQWSSAVEGYGGTSPAIESTYFEFTPDYAEAFEAASSKLASLAPPQEIEVVGWVSVISRPERDEPGVIRLKVLSGTVSGTLRIKVTDQQFAIAMESMRLQLALSVIGSLEFRGKTRLVNISYLEIAQLPDNEFDD